MSPTRSPAGRNRTPATDGLCFEANCRSGSDRTWSNYNIVGKAWRFQFRLERVADDLSQCPHEFVQASRPR